MQSDDQLMRYRIAFARSVSDHSLRLVGFIDTKTSIIVAINGVLLGLLFGSARNNLVPMEPLIQSFFIVAVLFLGASTTFGLFTIIPNIARKVRYSESLMSHETILDRKPYEDSILNRARNTQPEEEVNKKFKEQMSVTDDKEILKQEICNVYRLVEALAYQFRWVRLSISFLILAVIILSVVLFIQMFNQTASIYLPEECARSPKSYDVNVTYPWKCSMFKENSLAEICAQNPQRFNLMLKDCSRFIPDEASIASLIS